MGNSNKIKLYKWFKYCLCIRRWENIMNRDYRILRRKAHVHMQVIIQQVIHSIIITIKIKKVTLNKEIKQ